MALAFVPEENVKGAFQELKLHMPEDADSIVDYFERTYVQRITYESEPNDDGTLMIRRRVHEAISPPFVWNVHERVVDGLPRTNNQLEGWHRRFQTAVNKPHPNIHEFMVRLKEEQDHTEAVIQQLVAGQEPKKPRKKVLYLYIYLLIYSYIANILIYIYMMYTDIYISYFLFVFQVQNTKKYK